MDIRCSLFFILGLASTIGANILFVSQALAVELLVHDQITNLSSPSLSNQNTSKAQNALVDLLDKPEILAQKLSKLSPQEKKSFYSSYLAKFYPRALVIRGNFLAKMSIQNLDKALDDIVDIFKKNPSFYFTDDTAHLKIGFYWEAVVDQLSLISEFLKKAYIDLNTQEIFLLEPLLFGVGSSHINCNFLRRLDKKKKPPMKALLVYLREKRLSGFVRFYATYFDYLVKLFNEGVLFKDLKQAQRYQHQLEFVMTKLRNTEFERSYDDAFKVYKELLNILQAQVTRQEQEDNDDDYDVDYESPQLQYARGQGGAYV